MFPRVFANARRLPLALVIISSLLQAGLAVIIAFKMRKIFAAFTGVETEVGDLPWQSIVSIGLATLGILILRVFQKSAAEHAAQLFVKELRLAIFNRVSRMSRQSLNQFRSGSLQIRFVGDLSAIKNWVGIAIPGLITAVFLLPALIYLLFSIHQVLALIGALIGMISIAAMLLSATFLHQHHHKLRDDRGALANFVSARIKIANYLRVMGLRQEIVRQMNVKSDRVRRSAINKVTVVNSFKSIPEFGLQLLVLVSLCVSIILGMSAAEGAIVLAILAIFQQPLSDLAGFWDKQNAYRISRKKCMQILEVNSMTAGKKLSYDSCSSAKLEVEGIACEKYSLPNIKAKAGDIIEVSGDHSTGKTHLLELLVGLRESNKTCIKYNGLHLFQLTERERRSVVFYQGSYVPVFNSSLKSAITLGANHKISSEQLMQLIQMVGLNETIDRLGGLTFKVKENGESLSSSDINKIAICRLLLTKAQVVVIDDFDKFQKTVDFDLIKALLSCPNRIVVFSTLSNTGLKIKNRRAFLSAVS